MGTEYLAGLYEGTSQNYILLLLSLHVLGISISKEFFVFLMLFWLIVNTDFSYI